MKDSEIKMADIKPDGAQDAVQDSTAVKPSGVDDGGYATASPANSPTENKSDNYFSRKIGSVFNRSLRKFKKSGSQDKVESEDQNGHDSEEHSPPCKSPEKSPRSPSTPKSPGGSKQSKFQRIFRSSKRSKSADFVEGEAASTSNILDGGKDSTKEKHTPVTKYGEQKQIVVDGKSMKEIEVTGEKQQETLPETRRHRRISKSRRKAEFEGDELKVQCRDLNPVDYEGWLYKKSGGTTLSPVVWKQCWVVLKHGILYLYKTSFDIAAQHAYSVRNFSVAPVEEKRKFTFKLVPKNVPPEALQDAKGVVFSCEASADVERWCDVLNKAALGFIIQPSPRPEKEEPVRRRCQSSAVRRPKPNANGVNGHRVRSTTFTGETTGLPSTFGRSGGATRVRKISGSGSSSVLAVGNMFLAIEDPADKKRKSNTDLSSFVYKEQLVDFDNSSSMTMQQATTTTAEDDDEVRMQVKKEVERINKHSKPTKPVEGKGQTVASAKKADIIRQEIMNLKEIESQRVNSQGDEDQDASSDGSEAKEAEDQVLSETTEDQVEVTEQQTEATEAQTEAAKGLSEVTIDQTEVIIDQTEIIIDQTEVVEDQTEVVEDQTEVVEDQTEVVDDVSQVPDNLAALEEKVDGLPTEVTEVLPQGKSQDEENEVFDGDIKDEVHTSAVFVSDTEVRETGTDDAHSYDTENQVIVETKSDSNEPEDVPVENDLDSGISVEDYLRQIETEQHDIPVEEYLEQAHGETVDECSDEVIDARDAVGTESCHEKGDDHTLGKEDSEMISDKEGVHLEEGTSDQDSSESEENETDEESEPETRPKGMIPAKQQRMLIDAVLSLDYPSDSESEPEDDEEICHFAKIERPSEPRDEDEAGNEVKDVDVIINAPPGFDDHEATHQGQFKVKEHDVQYGATTEGKSVAFHTYIKPDADRTDMMEAPDTESSIPPQGDGLGGEESPLEERMQHGSRCEVIPEEEADRLSSASLISGNDPQAELEDQKNLERPPSKQTFDQTYAPPALIIDFESGQSERSGELGDELSQGECSVLINMVASARASNASEQDLLDGDNWIREERSDEQPSESHLTASNDVECQRTTARDSGSSDEELSSSEEETAIDEIESDEEELHPKATVKIVKVSVTQRGMDQQGLMGTRTTHESSV